MAIDFNENAAEVARQANKRKEAEVDAVAGGLPKKKLITRKPEDYSEVVRTTKSDQGPFAAFLVKPKNVHFDVQDTEEKILLLLRRHFVTNIPWIVSVVIALFAPILATFIPAFLLLPVRYQLVGSLVWYLVVFGFSLEQFLSWYFHVYIVTDERIIDYDFYSILHKRVSKAKIDRIEDVTYQMGGVLQSMFHYGDVFVQTAGEQRELDFESVPRPELVGKLLNELLIEEEQEKLDGRVR